MKADAKGVDPGGRGFLSRQFLRGGFLQGEVEPFRVPKTASSVFSSFVCSHRFFHGITLAQLGYVCVSICFCPPRGAFCLIQ